MICVGFIIIQSMIPEHRSYRESVWFTKNIVNPIMAYFHIFLDETLQIFTGRGTLVSDIWIDLIGVVVGIGIGKVILERKNEKDNDFRSEYSSSSSN